MFIQTTLIKLLGHTQRKGHGSRMGSSWEEERIQWKKEELKRKWGVKMSEITVYIMKLSNNKN